MKHVPKNVNLEEYIKYYIEPEQRDVLEILLVKLENDTQERIENATTDYTEILEEQLNFATDLVDEIEKLVKDSTGMKEFKEEFNDLVTSSNFER